MNLRPSHNAQASLPIVQTFAATVVGALKEQKSDAAFFQSTLRQFILSCAAGNHPIAYQDQLARETDRTVDRLVSGAISAEEAVADIIAVSANAITSP